MKLSIEINLKPFTVPNFVVVEGSTKPRQEGFQEAPKFALEELDADTLGKLCDEFTDAVFKKAGKQRPPLIMTG